MKIRGKELPLPLVSLIVITAVMIGAYAPGYIWRVDWNVYQLTSFEVCSFSVPGDSQGDQFVIRCRHLDPPGEAPPLPPDLDPALIGESVVPLRTVWPFASAIIEDNETIVPEQLIPPSEMVAAVEEFNKESPEVKTLQEVTRLQIIELAPDLWTELERATIATMKEQGMRATVLAIADQNRIPLPPINPFLRPRYHEFIQARSRLLVTFTVPEADRAQAAGGFFALSWGFQLFDCATGSQRNSVMIPLLPGSPAAWLTGPGAVSLSLGSATLMFDPGLWCVMKWIWWDSMPIKGEVAGAFRVIIAARVVP